MAYKVPIFGRWWLSEFDELFGFSLTPLCTPWSQCGQMALCLDFLITNSRNVSWKLHEPAAWFMPKLLHTILKFCYRGAITSKWLARLTPPVACNHSTHFMLLFSALSLNISFTQVFFMCGLNSDNTMACVTLSMSLQLLLEVDTKSALWRCKVDEKRRWKKGKCACETQGY